MRKSYWTPYICLPTFFLVWLSTQVQHFYQEVFPTPWPKSTSFSPAKHLYKRILAFFRKRLPWIIPYVVLFPNTEPALKETTLKTSYNHSDRECSHDKIVTWQRTPFQSDFLSSRSLISSSSWQLFIQAQPLAAARRRCVRDWYRHLQSKPLQRSWTRLFAFVMWQNFTEITSKAKRCTGNMKTQLITACVQTHAWCCTEASSRSCAFLASL